MIKKFFLAILLALVSVYASADENDNAAVEDFATALAIPKLSPKSVAPIKEHMALIRDALRRKGLNASSMRNGEVVRVDIPCSVLFAPNDTSLKMNASAMLSEFRSILHNPTMYKVVVAVYTDDTGDDEYAEAITWTRAEKIYNVLYALTEGVKNPNLTPYGMGHDESAAQNNSIANRALNRRASIFIIPEWHMVKDAAAGKLGK